MSPIKWSILVLAALLASVLLAEILAVTLVSASKPKLRVAVCINSACDVPCEKRGRFVRHAGTCVKGGTNGKSE